MVVRTLEVIENTRRCLAGLRQNCPRAETRGRRVLSPSSELPMSTNDTRSHERSDACIATEPPQECPHGNEHCPVNNVASDATLPCWECWCGLKTDTPETDAWEVVL
jgi:hypothetical protein